MKFLNAKSLVAAALGVATSGAYAIDVDGTAEGAYGSALFTQSIGTGFGDNSAASPVVANGSEIDGFFGFQDAASLYGVSTGNLESNFNHAVFFIDTGAGGLGQVGNDNASTADFGFLNSLAGTTFDTGFSASYALWFRNGNGDASNTLYATLAKLGSGGGDVFDIASTFTGDTTTIRTVSTTGFAGALNNVNVGGVNGTSGSSSSGAGVTTGIEFSLDRGLLGGSTGDIRIAGFITGGNYLSNQVIGGLPLGTDNLGNATPTDFRQYAGDQFVTVAAPVPEPASMLALGAGAAALLRRRRK